MKRLAFFKWVIGVVVLFVILLLFLCLFPFSVHVDKTISLKCYRSSQNARLRHADDVDLIDFLESGAGTLHLAGTKKSYLFRKPQYQGSMSLEWEGHERIGCTNGTASLEHTITLSINGEAKRVFCLVCPSRGIGMKKITGILGESTALTLLWDSIVLVAEDFSEAWIAYDFQLKDGSGTFFLNPSDPVTPTVKSVLSVNEYR